MKFKWPFVRRSTYEQHTAALDRCFHTERGEHEATKRRLAMIAEDKFKAEEELESAQKVAAEMTHEYECEVHRNQALISRFEQRLDFGLPVPPIRVSLEQRTHPRHTNFNVFELRIPTFVLQHVMAPREIERANPGIPQIKDMLAEQWGRRFASEVTKCIRKQLEEYK